ncbi:Gypsy retrotransposon integrase-like protein 1 [Exophiala xenobiotica]|nr:Gypsy retrotransposon integrase-like protein 1 [Exophiala xenobiotica]
MFVGCSYEQSRSPRLSTAAYVRELETKIHRLTELLGQSTPEDGNTCDPTGRHHSSRSTLSSDGEAVNHEEAMAVVYVETMMDGVGHLRQEQDGAYIYHGHYAGLTLLERVYACCRQQMPKATEDVTFSIARIFDGPLPACSEFRSVSREAQGTLPERATAEELISVALNNACFLLPFVHGPTLARELDRIYSVESNHYCETDSRSQALFYAILAVGALFSSMNRGICNDNSSLHFHYFQTAIGMIDPAYCRDLVILQAIIFVIMYLQGTGRLSHCYSYLALASGSAFQMGIHRNSTPPHLDLVQVEIRKRVYWSLYTIDIYTSTVLGLPRTIADYPSDQEELSEIVAWGATSGRCHLEAPTASSVLTLANHHIKILNIMAKVVNFLCSTKMQPAGCNRYCQVEAARLSQIESDLEEWYTTLPPLSNKSDPIGFDPIR